MRPVRRVAELGSLAAMNLPLILVGAILAQGLAVPVSNGATLIETNFVSGATLSGSELDAVVQLANVCGITNVTGVSTERHLSVVSIVVRGDEKIEARRVRFKTLLARRVGWPGGKLPTTATRSVGEFWMESTTRPQEEERMIVRIGDREVRVGLLNGIKPGVADKIVEAFVKGRVRGAGLPGVDVTRPSWIGISGGKTYIIFASSPHERFTFTLEGDQVTIVDQIRVFE